MNVAIVGCGRIGRVHAAAARSQRDVGRLVLHDPGFTGTDWAAARLVGEAWAGDLDSLLDEVRPDVVHVCTPPATHAAIAIRALEAGAHVLVEKPLALSAADGLRLGAALRPRPGALCVDHNFLFEPHVLRARRWVAEGRIGHVFAAQAFYGIDMVPGERGPGAWALDLPGGRFTDLLPHPLYLVAHFLGEVHGVSARTASSRPGEATSELSALLECERGLGMVQISLASVPWELGLTLRGTAGTIRIDLAAQSATLIRPRAGSRRLALLRQTADLGLQSLANGARRLTGKATGRLRGYPGLRALVARFYEAVRAGLPPPVPYGDGLAVVSVMERIRLRLATRQPASASRPLRRLA